MKYCGIIFDFNGVLLWDIPWQRQAWQMLARKLGRKPLDSEAWKKVQGESTREALPELIGAGADADTFAADEKLKDDLYREVAQEQTSGMQLSPGAEDLLELLVIKEIPRAIATSSTPSDMAYFIEALDLERWFHPYHIVSNDGTLAGKPAPDLYLEAARRIEVSIAECIVIEDSLSGIEGAAAAGAGKIIGLGIKDRHSELISAGAHMAIESLEEIGLKDFE